jgi:hypothetical protein
MSAESASQDPDDLKPEYEFDYSKSTRGKYYSRMLSQGASIVVLDPDIAAAFRDSTSVNQALRSLIQVSETTQKLIHRPKRSRARRTSATPPAVG